MGGLLPQWESQGPLDGSWGATTARVDEVAPWLRGGGRVSVGRGNQRGEDKMRCVPSCGRRGRVYHGKGHGGASTSTVEQARDGGERWRLLPGLSMALRWGGGSVNVQMREG